MEILSSTLAKKKILHVENISMMRNTIHSMLSELGFTSIEQAADGLIALDKCKYQNFDLIISDWDMPRLDGLGLLKKIRMNEKSHLTPFILISGIADYKQVKLAIEFGVTEYITKPFTAKLLQEKIVNSFKNQPIEYAAYPNLDVDKNNSTFTSHILVITQDDAITKKVTPCITSKSQVKSCLDIKEAINLIRQDKYIDVVLLDSELIDLTTKAAFYLKRKLDSGQVTIIILLRKQDKGRLQEMAEFGFFEYIEFPETLYLLQNKVKNIQEHKQALLNMNLMVKHLKSEQEEQKSLDNDLLLNIKKPLESICQTSNDIANKYHSSTYVQELTGDIINQSSYMHSMLDVLEHLPPFNDKTETYAPEVINLKQHIKSIVEDISALFLVKKTALNINLPDDLQVIVNPKQVKIVFILLLQSLTKSIQYNTELKLDFLEQDDKHISVEFSAFCNKDEHLGKIINRVNHQLEASDFTRQLKKLTTPMKVNIRYKFNNNTSLTKVQLTFIRYVP